MLVGMHCSVVVNDEAGREVEHGDDSVSNIAVGEERRRRRGRRRRSV